MKRGDWVRVKKGAYADDMGLVEAYDSITNQVEVKLIPRVDFEMKPVETMDEGKDCE